MFFHEVCVCVCVHVCVCVCVLLITFCVCVVDCCVFVCVCVCVCMCVCVCVCVFKVQCVTIFMPCLLFRFFSSGHSWSTCPRVMWTSGWAWRMSGGWWCVSWWRASPSLSPGSSATRLVSKCFLVWCSLPPSLESIWLTSTEARWPIRDWDGEGTCRHCHWGGSSRWSRASTLAPRHWLSS